MNRRTALPVVILLLSALLPAGCARATRPAPELTFLDVQPGPVVPASVETGEVLMLRRLEVQSPFDDPRFTYRTRSYTFQSDYYVRFIDSPADFLTDRLEAWLDDSGLFLAVVEPGSSVEFRYVLEGEIVELFGDYIDPQQPTAIIGATFTLVDDLDGAGKIVFQKGYREVEPIHSPGAEALAAGWGSALKRCLS